MTQPGLPADGAAPRNRRDVLRLGVAAFGSPLLAAATTPHERHASPTQGAAEATPLSDFADLRAFPVWEGETFPDHPDPCARTVNNLMFMGVAMHNFAAMNDGRFPAAAIRRDGEAILSWRVAILPFLEQFALFERFHLDEKWDSPHNASLLKEMPRVYAPVTPRPAAAYTTPYQLAVGPHSLFHNDDGKRVDVDIFERPLSRPPLMIVEAAEPVAWTKPADLAYVDEKPLPRLGGPFEGGSFATFADGSVRFLSRDHSSDTLRALVKQWRA